MHRVRADDQTDGVAVARRLGDRIGTDDAARAALVLDDYRLADGLGHFGGEDARKHIGRPAGRERRNDADRLRRIRLGPAADRGARHDGRRETGADNAKPHRLLPGWRDTSMNNDTMAPNRSAVSLLQATGVQDI